MKWIKKSMLRKLVSSTVIINLIVFLALGIFISQRIKHVLVENAQEKLLTESENISNQLNVFFAKNGAVVEQLATNQEVIKLIREVKNSKEEKFSHPKFKSVFKTFQEIKKNDSNIALVWSGITAVDGLVIDSDYDYLASADYDIESRAWYKKMSQKGGLAYSNPYIDTITKKLVVSIVEPVYDQGKIVGNVGIDLMIDKVGQLMSNYLLGETGYAILISDDGTVVYHPDKKKILAENITKIEGKLGQLGKRMVAGESGIAEYNLEEVDKYFAFSPIKSNGWSVGVMINQNEIMREASKIIVLVAVMFITGLLILTTFTILIIKNSLKRVPDLLDKMNRFSEGNLSVNIDDDSEDEIGQISSSFNKMVNNLKNIVTNIANNVEDISAYSEELSASAEEGNATVETTNDLIDNITAGIQEISATSEELASFSQEVSSVTNTGIENIEATVKSIGVINKSVRQTVTIIEKLDYNSKEIGQIIDLIDNIADQTNLLALNAAIEAARAGEHGQGFAVVAEEIRQLANETTKATEKISKLVRKTQTQSNKGIEKIRELEESAKEGKEVAEKTGNIFNDIRSSVEEISIQVEQTSRSTNELAQDSDEISSATENIKSMSNEVADSSQELANMSQKLQLLIDTFEV